MKRISYSAIRRFENCQASYLYYLIIPRIDFAAMKDVSLFGRKFHEWAEINFKPNEIDSIIQEDEVDKKDLEDMAIAIRGREYYAHPAVNELEITYTIDPIATTWGFPDRICIDIETRSIIVVDYKTTFDPDPIRDIKQLQLYAYIIYCSKDMRNKLLGELIKEHPDKIDILTDILDAPGPDQFQVIIDYVKADYQYQYQFDEQKIKRFERYLFGVLRRISDVETEFAKHKNIRKITHSDGNCHFCNMSGLCLPYQILINSYYDTEFEKEVTQGWAIINAIPVVDSLITTQFNEYEEGTPIGYIKESFCSEHGIEMESMLHDEIRLSAMGLISEFQERQRLHKINDLRLTALKRSLLMRHEEGDTVVNSYFRKQKNKMTSYPTSEVLKAVLPKIVKGALKDVRFKDMIDYSKIEKELQKVIETMVNSGIKKSNIPEEYHEEMEKHKTIYYARPFLKSNK